MPTTPASVAPRQRTGHPILEAVEADGVDDLGDAVPPGARDLREVAQVLGDAEVGVHGGSLRDVADEGAQRRGSGRLPEDFDPSLHMVLDADDRAHQRRLAAAARPEQARHGSDRRHQRDGVQDVALAPAYVDAGDGYRRRLLRDVHRLTHERVLGRDRGDHVAVSFAPSSRR